MRFIFTTCDKTRKIVEAQKFLFKKYVGQEPEYIDLKDMPVREWCWNVYMLLSKLLIEDEYIIFGLDDFLPKSKCDLKKLDDIIEIMNKTRIDRFELSSCAIGFNRGKFISTSIKKPNINFLLFPDDAVYSVSTQLSVWRTSSLYNVLLSGYKKSPWEFEKDHRVLAACFEKPVISYIEESALSKKWEGKVNVNGLSKEDVQELINLNFLNEKELINVS